MKIFTLLILSLPAFSLTGIITAHKVPIYMDSNINSQVLEFIKLGKKVFVHDTHGREKIYYNHNMNDPEKSFYLTLSKNGQEAYIEKRFVKIAYQNNTERMERVSPFSKNDPTDYRLEEPLPRGYPLNNMDKKRAIGTFLTTPALKISYPYKLDKKKSRYGNRLGFNLIYLSKVNNDNYDRFYFGFKTHFLTSTNEHIYENNNRSSETLTQIALGPYISYDFFRNEKYLISNYLALPVSYNRAYLEVQGDSIVSGESRIFSNFNLTPETGVFLKRRNFIPDLDFVLGVGIQVFTKSAYKRSKASGTQSIWQTDSENDQLEIPHGISTLFSIGIHSSY